MASPFIAIAYLRISKPKHLPAHPFAPALWGEWIPHSSAVLSMLAPVSMLSTFNGHRRLSALRRALVDSRVDCSSRVLA